jgi:serine/threonine-protein kinase
MLIDRADDGLRIADFGLALAFGRERFGGASSRSGTPGFAAPEQLLGEPVDYRADLYSLSAVACYTLTGRAPFPALTVETIVAQQAAAGVLPDLAEQRPDLDWIIPLLSQGLSFRPADRPASAEEYSYALRRAIRKWRANPIRRIRDMLRRD